MVCGILKFPGTVLLYNNTTVRYDIRSFHTGMQYEIEYRIYCVYISLFLYIYRLSGYMVFVFTLAEG